MDLRLCGLARVWEVSYGELASSCPLKPWQAPLVGLLCYRHKLQEQEAWSGWPEGSIELCIWVRPDVDMNSDVWWELPKAPGPRSDIRTFPGRVFDGQYLLGKCAGHG